MLLYAPNWLFLLPGISLLMVGPGWFFGFSPGRGTGHVTLTYITMLFRP